MQTALLIPQTRQSSSRSEEALSENSAPNTTTFDSAFLPSHTSSQELTRPRAQQGKPGFKGVEVLWGRGLSLRQSHRYPEPSFACFCRFEHLLKARGMLCVCSSKWDAWTSPVLTVRAVLISKPDQIRYRTLPSSVITQYNIPLKCLKFMLSLLLFTSTVPFCHPVLSKMWLQRSFRERLAFSWHPDTEQKQRIKMFCDTFSTSMLKEFG